MTDVFRGGNYSLNLHSIQKGIIRKFVIRFAGPLKGKAERRGSWL